MALQVGSKPRVKLTLGLPYPLTGDDIDWSVRLINGSKRQEFHKSQCFKEDGEWYCIADTSILGKGQYKVEATYVIPDEHEPERHTRDIICDNKTNIRIGF